MANELQKGTKIMSKYGVEITVDTLLGSGGQGDVYRVSYGNELKALKWYHKSTLGDNPNVLRKLITDNIESKAPSKEFLWPTDITEDYNDTFGYIMDLRPDGYHEIGEFMLRLVSFKSFKTIVDASLNIVKAFRILHNKGYSYQDMNDGNFFINPDNGKVLICDNDNVAPLGTPTRILGKPGYMAPEIVMGKGKPDKYSDRFSLSVILFILLCSNHPLEGRRVIEEPCMTPSLQEKLYGSGALFVMDPNDTSNAPHPLNHKNVLMIWKFLPVYIQNIFLKAFSQEALHTPNKRPEEFEWMKELVRFRSEIVPCGCGDENFATNGAIPACGSCSKQYSYSNIIEFDDYSVPAIAGTRIYRCQLGISNADEALNPVGNIVANPKDPSQLGLLNLDSVTWIGTTPSGKRVEVKHKERIPVKSGISVKTSSTSEFKIVSK